MVLLNNASELVQVHAIIHRHYAMFKL